MRTEKPRDCSRAPSDAAAIPLPREETTPPVMKTYRVMDDRYTEPTRVGGRAHIGTSRMRQRRGGKRCFPLRPSGGGREGCHAPPPYPPPLRGRGDTRAQLLGTVGPLGSAG